ncbi:MAG: hypothetical protein AB1640_18200 [bacterium]
MDEGSSGQIEPGTVFLSEQGTLQGTEPAVLPVTIPYGVSLLDITLEVTAGEADLLAGVEDPPTDYFCFGQGLGKQKILVGPGSHQPLEARTWYVEVVSPFGTGAEWRLTAQRRPGSSALPLTEQEGDIPAGQSVSIALAIPEDADSLEIVLESLQGDADLLLGFGQLQEASLSLNPGTGFEVVTLGPETVEPLRGQTAIARLESYDQDTRYRFTATYLAASPEGPPAAAP